MVSRTKKIAVAAGFLGLVALISHRNSGPANAVAQSGQRGSGTRSAIAGSTQAGQSFERQFWAYLENARYKNWAPVPGKSGDFSPGQAPHGKFLKMYLNRTAAGNMKDLPHGSIIVKENYGPKKKKLMAVTVMYRVKGFDPKNGDWYWVKYMPDGSVARTPADKGSKPIAGRFASCIDCHNGAEGKDFVFANDK